MIITLWNYKGGVGKSTISIILAEIAASNGLRTIAVDLDDQHTLTHALGLTGSLFKTIEVRSALTDFRDADITIVDTHQTLDNLTINALKAADFVLVPVLPDYFSILNLRHSWNYLHDVRGSDEHTFLVKNSMTNIKFAADIEQALDAQAYPVAGRLPLSNILMRNIASGKRWNWSMRSLHRQCFIRLFNFLREAHNV